MAWKYEVKISYLKEVGAPWIDKARVDLTRRLHYFFEITFLGF